MEGSVILSAVAITSWHPASCHEHQSGVSEPVEFFWGLMCILDGKSFVEDQSREPAKELCSSMMRAGSVAKATVTEASVDHSEHQADIPSIS